MRLAVALVLLSGCDIVFGVSSLTEPIDAPALPIDAPPCQPQQISDDFTGTTVCDDWGDPTDPGSTSLTSEGGGMLIISLKPNTASSQGGCISRVAADLTDSGLFLQVTSIVSPDNTYMFFKIESPTPAGSVTISLSVGGGSFFVSSGATTLASQRYDPVMMRWWRIRPDRNAGAVVGEVSPDGLAWQVIGAATGVVPAAATVELTAGVFATTPDPGTAIVEDFNICPK